MKRIVTILTLLLCIATTNAQLHDKLGTMLYNECKKGNIVKLQAHALDTIMQTEYKELIRKFITKELSEKCDDKEALRLILDNISSSDIIIWQPNTTKGHKKLNKQLKKFALHNKFSVFKELILFKSKIFRKHTKSIRIQKCLDVADEDKNPITTILSSIRNNTLNQLQIAAKTKQEGKETFYILYYINNKLIYWSSNNK